MKRIFAALCGAVLAVSAVSCGKIGEKSNDENSDSVKTSVDVLQDMGQVIWDNDAITVTFESYDDSAPLEPVITLKVHNKIDRERTLGISDVCENDFQILNLPLMENFVIPAGETVDSVISFYSGIGTELDEIGKISFNLSIANPFSTSSSELDLESGEISFFTGNKDWEQTMKIPEGELIYDEDGVRITAVFDSEYYSYRYSLPLFVENNSSEEVVLWLDSMRFDGVEGEVELGFLGAVASGKRSVEIAQIYHAYEAAGISLANEFIEGAVDIKPEKSEAKFTINKYDDENNESSIETDYLEIKGLKQ